MVHSFLVYLQLSVGSYLNLWKDSSKKGYNTAMRRGLNGICALFRFEYVPSIRFYCALAS